MVDQENWQDPSLNSLVAERVILQMDPEQQVLYDIIKQ
jgi:hypothetical protein